MNAPVDQPVTVEYIVVKTDDEGDFYLRVIINRTHHSDHGPFDTQQECEDFREIVIHEMKEGGFAFDVLDGSGTLQ